MMKNGAIDNHIGFYKNIWLKRSTAQTRKNIYSISQNNVPFPPPDNFV